MKVMCSVFDSAVQAYATPFFCPSTGYAVRSFTDEVNRSAPDNALFAHPEDYTLFFLGNFDEERGVIDGEPRVLMRGKDVMRNAEGNVAALRSA